MSKLVDIRIGDIEGNNQKHAYYIFLEDDEYKTNSLGILELTEKGKDTYKKMWDTRYYNYSIVDITPDKKEQLLKQIENTVGMQIIDHDVLMLTEPLTEGQKAKVKSISDYCKEMRQKYKINISYQRLLETGYNAQDMDTEKVMNDYCENLSQYLHRLEEKNREIMMVPKDRVENDK